MKSGGSGVETDRERDVWYVRCENKVKVKSGVLGMEMEREGSLSVGCGNGESEIW